jgi:ATP-dependent Lon protease
MTRDIKAKTTKKEQIRRSKRLEEKTIKRKTNKDSDSDNNGSDSESEKDEAYFHEFRKFLYKKFPSKNLNDKIKSGEKLKKVLRKQNNDSEEYEPTKSPRRRNKKTTHQASEDEDEELWETASERSDDDDETLGSQDTEDDDEDDEDDEYEEEEEEYDDEERKLVKRDKKNKPAPSNVNITFTIEQNKNEWSSEEDYDSDYEGYEDSDDATEDEDESVSSDSSSDSSTDSSSEDEKLQNKKSTRNKITSPKNKNKIASPKNKENDDNNPNNYTGAKLESYLQIKQLLEKFPNDKSIKKCVEVYEEETKKETDKKEKKEKKQKNKNMRIFRKIIRDKNSMNDFGFYEKLNICEQKNIIKELKEINKITRIEKPYRLTLLESNIPVQFKAAAMKKINSLKYLEPGSGEFYKIKNWVDTFMRIPFTKSEELPISIDDGVDKCHEFMEEAKKTLDNAVYGLNDAKMQIMQMLGQLLTNPKSIGTAIAIHGPPGTGKTSLVKEGISKILNRPFAFIALGGATDSSFLEGHSYTYEGSTWGKIVQILIDSRCMNPVIYFDELDKISDTPRGEEIAGILTHLTDTSQNSQFHDKYFAEINFDLSKCLFIFSYNDESKVNPILKDRMYRIQTKGYNQKQKTTIGNNYLLPKIREQVRFNEGNIIIPDDTIHYIIDHHCNKEDGVRNLKRCLEIIYTKLNLYRLMKPGSNLFEEDMSLKVEFPFNVTKDIVDKLIKRDNANFTALYNMYI